MSIPSLKRHFNESRGIISRRPQPYRRQPSASAAAGPNGVDHSPRFSRALTGTVGETPRRGLEKSVGMALGFAVLMIVSAVFVVPKAEAQVSWTTEVVGSLTDTITQSSMAHNGNTQAVAYKYRGSGTNGKVGFSIRDPGTGVWNQQSGDITGNVNPTTIFNVQVAYITGTTWIITGADSTAGNTKAWRSTDNGVTWSVVLTNSVNCPGNVYRPYVEKMAGNNVMWACQGVGSLSTDNGATWGTTFAFYDNAGSTGETPSSSFSASHSILHWTGSELYAMWQFNAANGVGFAKTDNSANFWTVSWASTTCTPFGEDLGGARCDFTLAQGCGIACYTTAGNYRMAGTKTPILAADYQSYSFRSYVPTAANPWGFYQGFNGYDKVGQTAQVPESIQNSGCTGLGTHSNGLSDAVSANAGDIYSAAFICTTGTGRVGLNVNEKDCATGAWTNSFVNSAITSSLVVDVDMTPTSTYALYTNGGLANRVEVVHHTTPSVVCSTTIPVVTRAIPANLLVGGTADSTNSIILLRSVNTTISGDQKEEIWSLDGTSLANRGLTPLPVGCTFRGDSDSTYRHDGIMAFSQLPEGKQFAGFIDCTATSKVNGNLWRIRGGDLNSPDQSGTACAGDTFCSADITSSALSGCGTVSDNNDLPNREEQIDNIQSIPMSWETSGTGGANHATIGFAFNDRLNGNVGAWAIMERNGISDLECKVSLPFSSPGLTLQICSWRNQNTQLEGGGIDAGDKNDYLMAVGSGVATKVWRVAYTETAGFPTVQPHLAMTQVIQLSGFGSHSVATACAGTDAILADVQGGTAHINRVHVAGGAIGNKVWANDVLLSGNIGIRGLAISSNTAVFALSDFNTASITIGNAYDGTIYGSVPVKTGAVVEGMHLSDAGNSLVVWEDCASGSGCTGVTFGSMVVQKFDITNYTNAPEDNTRVDVGNKTVCLDSQGNPLASCGSNSGGGGGNETCTDTGDCGDGCNGSPECGAPGTGAGTACGETYAGTVKIGVTYVPLGTWTNCASMAMETFLTVITLIAAAMAVTIKVSNGASFGSPVLVGILGLFGYFVSLYLWQAPLWLIWATAAISLAVFGISKALKASGGGGASGQ